MAEWYDAIAHIVNGVTGLDLTYLPVDGSLGNPNGGPDVTIAARK